jgi:hypothetical protein
MGKERKSGFIKKFLTYIAKFGIITHQATEGNVDMTKEAIKNYTDEQEAYLATFDVIDNDTAIEIAAHLQKDVRSVRAKAVRMGVYKAKDKVSKSGAAIERKEAIVADIAAILGKNLDGLEKAPKQVLVALRAKLSA